MNDISPFAFSGSSLQNIDPRRLELLLQQSGWTVAGRRSGVYIRLLPPGGEGHSVLVPLDRDAPEYEEELRAALRDVQQFTSRDSGITNITARLLAEPRDSFRFRAETATPRGLIPWPRGERLVESARRVLSAGAKTHLEHLRYYGNRFGQFANRYLDAVLMGQTVPGSYVVTAFTSANGFINIVGSGSTGQEQPPLFELSSIPADVTSTRAVGVSVLSAAAATREALDHYRASGSIIGLDSMIARGGSYEMSIALNMLVSDSDGADISAEWDPVLEPPSNAPSGKIEFYPSDAEVLTRFSHQLAVDAEPPSHVTVMGRVSLLTNAQAGGPGVVGLENLSRTRPKKLRVHLSPEDYHQALMAHDENRAVVIEGRMEREGNVHWVYDGCLNGVLDPIELIIDRINSRPDEQIDGQLQFDDTQDVDNL